MEALNLIWLRCLFRRNAIPIQTSSDAYSTHAPNLLGRDATNNTILSEWERESAYSLLLGRCLFYWGERAPILLGRDASNNTIHPIPLRGVPILLELESAYSILSERFLFYWGERAPILLGRDATSSTILSE